MRRSRDCFGEGTCATNFPSAYSMQDIWFFQSKPQGLMPYLVSLSSFYIFAGANFSGLLRRLTRTLGSKVTICPFCVTHLAYRPAVHATGYQKQLIMCELPLIFTTLNCRERDPLKCFADGSMGWILGQELPWEFIKRREKESTRRYGSIICVWTDGANLYHMVITISERE